MKLKLPAIFGLLVLAAAASVDATTVLRQTIEDMTNASEVIVIGTARDSKTQWIDRTLYTIVTVEVSDTIKGAAASQIQVALLGGRDSNRRFPVAQIHPGAATLAHREEVVLFLRPGPDISGAYTIAGDAQGKYSIVKNEAGATHVARDLTTVQLQDASGVSRGTSTLQLLSEFLAEIRGYRDRER